MPQINNGKYPAWVAGEIVTAADLNSMITAATLDPSAITAQTDFPTLTGNEYTLIVDPVSGLLKKTQVENLSSAGSDIFTDSIKGFTSGGSLLMQGHLTGNGIAIQGNATLTVPVLISGKNTIISGSSSVDNTGYVRIVSGTDGIRFDSGASYTEFVSKVKFNTTDAIELPVGTTGQRPASPVTGSLRYNNTTNHTEVYNGTAWEAVGGSPFDGTGGNKIIAPDTTTVSASFSSADGESVVMTSSGHSVTAGQVIKVTTGVSGYSGNWTVISTNTNDFTFVLTTPAAANSGSCTYNKAGNYKVHIFTSGGTFVAGSTEGNVEVLVVGGGGGGSTTAGGGGGGAVVYSPYYHVNASQTITVTVGSGGAVDSNGTASVFGNIIAGGGYVGSGNNGGASGVGTIGVTSKAGGSGNVYGKGGGAGSKSIGWNGAGNSSSAAGGSGGDGYGSSIQGIEAVYGGGGGGGSFAASFNFDGVGVNGGGQSGYAGTPNTGGGGGGDNWYSGATAQVGGSGIVIVRYPYWL